LLPRLAACDPRYAAALVGGKNPEKKTMQNYELTSWAGFAQDFYCQLYLSVSPLYLSQT